MFKTTYRCYCVCAPGTYIQITGRVCVIQVDKVQIHRCVFACLYLTYQFAIFAANVLFLYRVNSSMT